MTINKTSTTNDNNNKEIEMSETTTTNNVKFVLTNEIDFKVELNDDDLLTPYKCSTILNNVLVGFGLPSVVPQMMYNYTMSRINKGKTPMIPCTSDGKIKFIDFKKWSTKYITKKLLNI